MFELLIYENNYFLGTLFSSFTWRGIHGYTSQLLGTLLHALGVSFFIVMGISEGVERGRECEATGQAAADFAQKEDVSSQDATQPHRLTDLTNLRPRVCKSTKVFAIFRTVYSL